jgi:hypothetical protein
LFLQQFTQNLYFTAHGGSTTPMFPSHHHKTHQLWLCASLLLLLTVLTACTSTGTTHIAYSSTSSALLASASPTPTPTTRTYTGAGFSLIYPSSWQAQGTGSQVVFQDAQGFNALTVVITPNPGGAKSAASLADSTFPLVEKAILTNPQATNVAPTVTVAGESWVQRGATGTLSTGGQSVPGTLLLLLDNHPASSPKTRAYEMYYGGPAATFEQKERTLFQAMLQSFKFTA